MKVLLAEDDPHIAKIIQVTLESLGQWSVTWVSDGESAFQELQDPSYDLVLLDEKLPGRSGQSVCVEMRSKGDKRPIVIMSACPLTNCQASAFIAKPFDPRQMFEQLTLLAPVQEVS